MKKRIIFFVSGLILSETDIKPFVNGFKATLRIIDIRFIRPGKTVTLNNFRTGEDGIGKPAKTVAAPGNGRHLDFITSCLRHLGKGHLGQLITGSIAVANK